MSTQYLEICTGGTFLDREMKQGPYPIGTIVKVENLNMKRDLDEETIKLRCEQGRWKARSKKEYDEWMKGKKKRLRNLPASEPKSGKSRSAKKSKPQQEDPEEEDPEEEDPEEEDPSIDLPEEEMRDEMTLEEYWKDHKVYRKRYAICPHCKTQRNNPADLFDCCPGKSAV